MDRKVKKTTSFKLNRVGIFGSKGFIGSHLLHTLDQKNIRYDIFDGDALDKNEVEKFFNHTKNSEIIFLIGTFNPPMDNLVMKNLLTLETVLEVGVQKGLKKMIYVSSIAVYGNPGPEGSLETDLTSPISLYGLTKKYCEECIHYYEENFGVKGILLRFPSVYGEGNNKGVIYEFIKRIQNKQPIIINGDGEQYRNFLHVSDAVSVIIKSLSIQTNEVINVANDRRITINDLVKMMSRYKKFDYVYDPSKNLFKDKLCMNMSKCKKLLDFTPRVEIESYIRQLYEGSVSNRYAKK